MENEGAAAFTGSATEAATIAPFLPPFFFSSFLATAGAATSSRLDEDAAVRES